MVKQEAMTPKGQEIQVRPEGDGLVPVSESLATMLARAEFDQRALWAETHRRQLGRVAQNIMDLVTLDEDSADEMIYALPRGGKEIEGPSIRFAEILFSQWGNCDAAARVVHVDRIEKYVEAEAFFLDLETGARSTERVRRRISDKEGRVFNDDMIVVTGNAARAIAKRNAILAGIPKPMWRRAYKAVEGILAGEGQSMERRRERALEAFAKWNISEAQIFAALGVKGKEDLTSDVLMTLTGMRSALKNGEATVAEMFSGPAPAIAGRKPGVAGAMETLSDGGASAATPSGETGAQSAAQTAGAGSQPQGQSAPAKRGRPKGSSTKPKPAGSGAAGGDPGGENKTGQEPATAGATAPSGGDAPSEDGKNTGGEPEKKPAGAEASTQEAPGGAGPEPSNPRVSEPSTPTEARAPDPQPLGAEDRDLIKAYHAQLGGALMARSLDNSSQNYIEDRPRMQMPHMETLAAQVLALHRERVTGKTADGGESQLSIADIDNQVRKLLA